MFTVTVPQIVFDASVSLIDTVDLNYSGHFNASKDQQLAGVVGENMIRHNFGIPYMANKGIGDGGWDIELCGVKIDIKVALRTSPRTNASENVAVNAREVDKYNPDSYLWTRLYQDQLTILGYATKRQFINVARLYNVGEHIDLGKYQFKVSSPMWSAMLDDVSQVDRWQDLEDEPPNVQRIT